MARPTDPRIAEELIAAIRSRPDGAAIEQLENVVKAPRRTLQRKLAELVRQGALRATGVRKARRYFAAEASVVTEQPAELRVSESGEIVRVSIRRPAIAREPVGYRADFLEGYRPNVDEYLSRAMRERLLSLGQTAGPERPAGTYARQILGRLLVDLSWASSRLEGNTYTRLDTQNLIELGRQAPGKDQREAQMILNHKAAIEMLVENVEDVGFDRYTICNLHGLLADNLLADPTAAGRLRRIDVSITGSVYQPLAIPQRLEELFDVLLAKASAIADPFEQAFFTLIHIPYLQPFEDVNKRVSRLAANIPFLRRNLVPLSFVDVPDRDYIEGLLGVYESNRIELARDVFLWAYERSCQRYTVVRDALPQPDPLRLRNRDHLIAIVNAIVRDDLAPDDANVRTQATPLATPADLEQLVAMAIAELHGLHEGVLARYRLRPSEFRRWRGRRT